MTNETKDGWDKGLDVSSSLQCYILQTSYFHLRWRLWVTAIFIICERSPCFSRHHLTLPKAFFQDLVENIEAGVAQVGLLLSAMVRMATSHQTLTALVCPCHDLTDRLTALCKTIQYTNKLNFEQLHQVFMATIENQSTLVSSYEQIRNQLSAKIYASQSAASG
jgi:hypothetical protein